MWSGSSEGKPRPEDTVCGGFATSASAVVPNGELRKMLRGAVRGDLKWQHGPHRRFLQVGRPARRCALVQW